MQLDKFSTCKKMIYLLLVFQLLCCCGVLVALKLELDIQTICLLAKVLGRLIMVICAICIVLSILLVRYSRCTNCVKPVKAYTDPFDAINSASWATELCSSTKIEVRNER